MPAVLKKCYRLLAKGSMMLAMLSLVMASLAAAVPEAKAADEDYSSVAQIASETPICSSYDWQARSMPGMSGGISSWVFGQEMAPDCQYFEVLKGQVAKVGGYLQMVVVRALSDVLFNFAITIGQQTAQWVLEGMHGQPAFWRQGFGGMVKNLGMEFTNRFIDQLDKQWGLGLCTQPNFGMKLALGIGSVAKVPGPDCTFQGVKENFESMYRQLKPRDIAVAMVRSVDVGGNDFDFNLRVNSMYLVGKSEEQKAAELDRQETKGLKTVKRGPLNPEIKTPAIVIQETINQNNQAGLVKDMTIAQVNNMALQAMWATIEQLPVVAGMAFLSTLATGALQKLLAFLMGEDSSDDTNYQMDLTNPYAEKAAEPKKARAKAFTDIISPNMVTMDMLDIVSEMAICPDNRGYWHCTMDDGMVSAVKNATTEGAYTVSRAAGLGGAAPAAFLHKDWELIPATDVKNDQDPGCYQRAYCASNLAKLRFARILPIGWELAANSPFNIKNSGKYVTLGTVIRGYNDCNKDNKLDAEHPWCHLIDPAWVLTAPPFKCQLKGYSDTLMVQGTSARLQECADPVSCLKRDDKGVCTGGYGYCLAEKTVWRFGADACDEKFVSCRTYKSRSDGYQKGAEVSYVRNSVDYGACNQDNVGCMFYATQYDMSVTSTLKWLNTATTDKKSVTLGTMPRVYFDSKVEKCDASGDGCTKVLRVQQGQNALNLVRNGSFEDTLKNQDGYYDGWSDNANPPAPSVVKALDTQDGDVSFEGSRSQAFGAVVVPLVQRVKVKPLRNYVLSFYARGNGPAGIASVTAVLLNAAGTDVAAGTNYYRSPNCNSTIVGAPGGAAQTRANVGAGGLTADWKRFTCEFLTNKDAETAKIAVAGTNAAIDAVQLEEGFAPTDFLDGNNPGLPSLHIKLPPEEFNCTGDSKLDRKECDGYAKMCLQADAGCQGYTEVGAGDTTEVPAILSQTDYCPNSCVGYAEYQKLPSAFDLVNTGAPVPSADPLDDPKDDTKAVFIPKQAQACNAAQAGCEGMTNVEAAALGGEEVAYLTYARACQKPNANSQTYFTWEGSDTTGYQLKTWSLIKNPTPVDPNDPTPHYAPLNIEKAGPDGILKNSADCNADNWGAKADADCRQFYDEQGKAFYAYYSKTVVSSADCRDYRKNNSNTDDCTKTGGSYRSETGDCLYSVLLAESAQCDAVNAGCRGYLGTTGRNTTVVLKETFANATSSNAFSVTGQGTTFGFSPEALMVGDYSLKYQSAVAAATFNVTFPATTNTLYSVSFWYKSLDNTGKNVTVSLGGNPAGGFKAGTDWKRYELGPFRAMGSPNQTLTFGNLPSPSYFDEITVQRLQDVVYVNKDSWTVPAECDQTPEGVPLPQAMLGCREYRDRNGKKVDLRQFSRLCRYESVGCAAFIDTRNSDSAYADDFKLAGYDQNTLTKQWDKLYAGTLTVTRPADRYLYAIDEPSTRCAATAASCRAFGKPTFDAFGVPSSTYETVYLKDDIKKYVDGGGEPDMLCRPSELLCDKFVSGPVTSYFRDPRDHVCEWKDKVKVKASANPAYPEGEYSGWFVKGAEPPVPCYPEKQAGGSSFLTEFTAAPNYRGWVNLCPSEQSECTEYRDPSDNSDQAHPQGKPYFFIANEALDKASCKGKVDPLSGCVLFRDMNDSSLPFSSGATYAKGHADGDVAVGTINCDNDPTNEHCKAASGRCTGLRVTSCGSTGCDPAEGSQDFITSKSDAVCTTDADCSHYPEPGNPVGFEVLGTCKKNDSNLILKVKLDRDCQTWLGCSSAETVYDPSQQKYIDLCTNLSACDQAGGAASKNFCGHYVDRKSDPTSQLAQGRFTDIGSYIKRITGFGSIDYTGYTIPNHFQVSDLQMRRVAYELMRPGKQRDALYNEFRLVAAVPMTTKQDCIDGKAACTEPWFAVDFKDTAYPYLNLCKHAQTGMIGYKIKDEPTPNCYLPIEKPYTTVLNEALGQFLGLPGNAQKISTTFEQSASLATDNNLNRHYPPVECRAHPEATSPFANKFIKDWDLTVDPPVPKTFLDGYDSVEFCEYGEDCDCSYRKVSYGAKKKYYSAFAGTAPLGICVGGLDAGKACDPDAAAEQAKKQGQADQASQNAALAQAIAGQNAAVAPSKISGSDIVPAGCRSGSCSPLDKDTFVRGVIGQCLQRDYSRKLGGALDRNPCLVWNPAPVLAGQQDRYHYEPTASYLPPASSGEYYCLSKSREPRTMKTQANHNNCVWTMFPIRSSGDGIKCDPPPEGDQKSMLVKTPPGKITHFDYHECYVIDTDVVNDHPMPWGYDSWNSDDDWYETHCGWGATLDGVRANGGESGASCASVRMTYAGGDVANDIRAGRWITTGRGLARNYAEYFIEFNDVAWAQWLYNNNKITATDPKVAKAALEQNFTSFVFNPMYKTGVGGTWACGESGWWVDEFKVDQSGAGWDSAAATLINRIMAEFKPLTSENFGYLKNEKGTKLARLPCKYPENGDDSEGDALCYYKYWETGLRADGQKKFRTFDDSVGGPRKLDPADVMFAESESSKPFFAIRAMFEDVSPEDNRVPENKMDPSGTQLGGPFRFVGWWVTASYPGATTERYMYMYLDVNHADICKQVARTSSPTTHETAAFTDRIWDGGAYSIPTLGFTYDTLNPPFGAAKHTKAIGKDPLYQMGPLSGKATFKLSGVRPTFLASGSNYAKTAMMPLGNWAYLNDIFAKIYNVYQYHDMPVGKNSWACIAGPNYGSRCPNLKTLVDDATVLYTKFGSKITKPAEPMTPAQQKNWNELVASTKASLSQKYCGYTGTCNPTLYDVVNDDSAFCNALSGVNAGLPCSASLTLEGYHVCHAAPVRLVNGEFKAQYVPCDLASGWSEVKGDDGSVSGYAYSGTDAVALADCNEAGIPGCTQGNVKFVQRKTAAKAGAFKCADAGVKFPDGTNGWCRQPSEGMPSLDCPLEVGPSAKGAGYSVCDKTTHRCTNGYDNAQCNEDYDCTFWWQTWWFWDSAKAGGQPTRPVPYPTNHAVVTGMEKMHHPGWFEFTASGGVINANHPAANALIGGVAQSWWLPEAHPNWLSTDGKEVKKDIGGNSIGVLVDTQNGVNRYDTRYLQIRPAAGFETINATKRFPGIFVQSGKQGGSIMNFIPGHCERLPIPSSRCHEFDGKIKSNDDKQTACNSPTVSVDVPYFITSDFGNRWQGPDDMAPGLCEGGVFDGMFCASTSTCKPLWAPPGDDSNFCQPVSDGNGNPMKSNSPYYDCTTKNNQGSPTATNPDEDNNSCTHGTGYYPRADLCGYDLNKAVCLTAVAQRDSSLSGPGSNIPLPNGQESYNLKMWLPPTDVSSGLHMPPYIADKNKKDPAPYEANYGYMSYYAPRPPTMAAPDTTRQCPSAGQCPISQVGTFALDGMAEGKVAYIGGQSVNTIQFYGWAADNQMGIKDIWVDWGDGTSQEFHDSRMKNKKPICGSTKECEFVPGLTCNSNNDCPPAGGKCVSTSYCASKPSVQCVEDKDCFEGGLDVGDKCQPRLTFGNSDRACEQNYFEYTHVYLCPKEKKPSLVCGDQMYCNRDNTQKCTVATEKTDCAPGDKCVAGIAPPGGCFDETNNACRFTPRVIIKDAWGWCSGECRAEDLGNGKLGMGFAGVNNILLPYGGCYDATGETLNRDSKQDLYVSGDPSLIGSSVPRTRNMCDPYPKSADKVKSFRPWTVFKGSLQLGVTQ